MKAKLMNSTLAMTLASLPFFASGTLLILI